MPLLRAEKVNTQPSNRKQNLKVVGRIPRKNTFHFTNGDGAQRGAAHTSSVCHSPSTAG